MGPWHVMLRQRQVKEVSSVPNTDIQGPPLWSRGEGASPWALWAPRRTDPDSSVQRTGYATPHCKPCRWPQVGNHRRCEGEGLHPPEWTQQCHNPSCGPPTPNWRGHATESRYEPRPRQTKGEWPQIKCPICMGPHRKEHHRALAGCCKGGPVDQPPPCWPYS
jgi:hypothetical protein